MSETRKLLEVQADNARFGAKGLKLFGWIVIVFGVILCITIVGLPFGIVCIGIGIFILVFSKRAERQTQALKGAAPEQAEIIEHQLQQARSQKPE